MPQTRMTNPFDVRTGLCRLLNALAVTLAITLALAGCGPGTGGTGTGPVTPTLGYSGSLFATTTTAASSTTAPGTGCATDCTLANLRLDTERVELTAPCLRFVFAGDLAAGRQRDGRAGRHAGDNPGHGHCDVERHIAPAVQHAQRRQPDGHADADRRHRWRAAGPGAAAAQ